MLIVCCVGSGLCDGLITRSEESCRVSGFVCVIVFDLETAPIRWPRPRVGLLGHRKKMDHVIVESDGRSPPTAALHN